MFHFKKFSICFIILLVFVGSLSSMAAADWPMFQDNNRHTGYVKQDTSFSTQTWTVQLDGAVTTTPVLCGDKLFVGTQAGTVYALDPQDGSILWNFTTNDAIHSSCAVSGNTLYVGSDDSYL